LLCKQAYPHFEIRSLIIPEQTDTMETRRQALKTDMNPQMKIDLKKDLKHLYTAPKKAPEFIDVPDMTYLMVDGTGGPGPTGPYADAIEALYIISYAAKFHIKKDLGGVDYGVMPLEGLWWTDIPENFSMDDRDAWRWTMMIMQPEWVTPEVLEFSTGKAANKLDRDLGKVRFDVLAEGRVVQVMHIGPYSNEPPVIQAMHRFVDENGMKLRDKHHEIYLSDPRRTKPEKLKTILRHPVEAK
jgi:hypothetical protein